MEELTYKIKYSLAKIDIHINVWSYLLSIKISFEFLLSDKID